MNLGNFGRRAGKLVIDNSPAILTGMAVAGTVMTAYLTGKASVEYTRRLAEEGYYDRDYKFERTPREHVEQAWMLYIPAATTSLLTVACIIGANQIGTRRAAAVAAAYTLSEKAFTEYREKIVERIGVKKEQGLRDELAQDRVTKNVGDSNEIVIVSGTSVLCYEAFTGRYFISDMETLRGAQNDINFKINSSYYASLSDFYEKVGLPTTAFSDEVGWNSDKLLELKFSTVLSNDSRPCIAIDFSVAPVRDYYRIG